LLYEVSKHHTPESTNNYKTPITKDALDENCKKTGIQCV